MNRFLFNILLIISVFFLNWWLLLLILMIGIFIFRGFYEGLLYAFIFDFIYGPEGMGYIYLKFTTIILFIIVFFIALQLKKHLRFYTDN